MVCAPDGLPLDGQGAAADVIGAALVRSATIVVIPAERLTDGFFELGTGMAGEITQKFMTYGLRLAVIGEVDSRGADRIALRAWISECNSGDQLWFEPTFDAFVERLSR